MKYQECIELIKTHSTDFIVTSIEVDLKNYIERDSKYLYLILWSSELNIYSWGTMSGSSNRLRKSSILNPKLTGKYDRRVDYLMLKKIYGFQSIYLFKTIELPTVIENILKEKHGEKYCYNGIEGRNRDEISMNVYEEFKLTSNYLDSSDEDKKNFDDYISHVFLGKMRHPINSKRTFFYGDSLEPGFLKTIGKSYLEKSIEKVLEVKFYK